jgi:hypothetical protein
VTTSATTRATMTRMAHGDGSGSGLGWRSGYPNRSPLQTHARGQTLAQATCTASPILPTLSGRALPWLRHVARPARPRWATLAAPGRTWPPASTHWAMPRLAVGRRLAAGWAARLVAGWAACFRPRTFISFVIFHFSAVVPLISI